MENFEFILILLACVIGSTVLNRFVRRPSLPLLQIIVGAAVSLALPDVVDVRIDSELFMVLFIAPLLFNEARRIDLAALWKYKATIFSLAIVLVFLTVLGVGFALHALVPSVSLAAAFACGAALGPTDASAVSALSAKVNLTERQSILLSGESLINDASGVVAFHFAILAAATGAFALAEAGESFLILFFGGIVLGLAFGFAGELASRLIRRCGVEDATLDVLYEVFTPFFVYFLAEWAGVSGVLAVVAAGLVMADRSRNLVSPSVARHQIVSDSFWSVFVFLINSIIFIMLGMQLPQAIQPALAEDFSPQFLLAAVGALTLIVLGCRFLWIGMLEMLRTDTDTGRRGWKHPLRSLRKTALLTCAGPKGAVTLSIIFTVPYALSDGAAFPNRDLLTFLTAGVILLTLICAEFLLPVLSKGPSDTPGPTKQELHQASIEVLERTIKKLRAMLDSGEERPFDPALRQTIGRYQIRLDREKSAVQSSYYRQWEELNDRLTACQQKRADELQRRNDSAWSVRDRVLAYRYLRIIRRNFGYDGASIKVGSRFHSLILNMALVWQSAQPVRIDTPHKQAIYYQTCMFAIELEYAALDCLSAIEEVAEPGSPQLEAAQSLMRDRKHTLAALWGHIDFGSDEGGEHERPDIDSLPGGDDVEDTEHGFSEQLAKLDVYIDEVEADALSIELDIIRTMLENDEIDAATASALRNRVYAMQMNLGS